MADTEPAMPSAAKTGHSFVWIVQRLLHLQKGGQGGREADLMSVVQSGMTVTSGRGVT